MILMWIWWAGPPEEMAIQIGSHSNRTGSHSLLTLVPTTKHGEATTQVTINLCRGRGVSARSASASRRWRSRVYTTDVEGLLGGRSAWRPRLWSVRGLGEAIIECAGTESREGQ